MGFGSKHMHNWGGGVRREGRWKKWVAKVCASEGGVKNVQRFCPPNSSTIVPVVHHFFRVSSFRISLNQMDVEKEKESFLSEFGEYYGYPNAPKNVDEIRASEFKRLDGLVYLDHAGATLYSELQMEAIFKDLTTNVYGNPHSQHDSSLATSETIRAARQLVLDFCNASPQYYKCIFTSGATSALKLVGEAFPWSGDSCFMYTMENHNSVLGIREYALSQGAVAFAIDIQEIEPCGRFSRSMPSVTASCRVAQQRKPARVQENTYEANSSGDVYNLFAFPSECNFSGVKYNLDLVNMVKKDYQNVLEGLPSCRGSCMVLIDAAKGSATEPPDLSSFPADFVVISFYKIFGYPTGLGALVVRNDAAEKLKKTYFGGGTVAASVADIDYVLRREGIEPWFEDGTQSFLSIASIHHGFKIINTLTVSSIALHTSSLAAYTRKKLFELRHDNGSPVCELYGPYKEQISCHKLGPTISFNLKRCDGTWFGYREVEKVASLSGIQLRTGCFCNPGACSKYLGLSHFDLLSNIEAGHVCWDDHDILHGKPTGAVRISFGYMSTFEDAMKFINFIVNSFGSRTTSLQTDFFSSVKSIDFSYKGTYLKSITIYPIKSCKGFLVDSWPLSAAGLQHDREWLLKSPSGEVLTQKKVPEMCHISTYIDLARGVMIVESPRCEVKLEIDLLKTASHYKHNEEIKIQYQRFKVQAYDPEVDLWFSNAIARPCILLRCLSSESLSSVDKSNSLGICRDVKRKLNFVNEGHILLISEASVSDLNSKLSSNLENSKNGQPLHVHPMRFRPNLLISGADPYAEDDWKCLTIGKEHFLSIGGCNRCQMINLDPQTGQVDKSKEPLATLASFRRVKGKILFGILLRYEGASEVGGGGDLAQPRLHVGQRLFTC